MGVFESGARASGNEFLARRGSFPLAFLEERDDLATLVGSSLIEKGQSARYYREETPDQILENISVHMGWLSHTSNQPPLYGQEEVETSPLAYGGDVSSPQSCCYATRAWGELARWRLLCHG